MKKGQKMSEEQKQKIRESVKKSNENSELRQKRSEAIKKALANPEVKQKCSEAAKKRYENPEARQKLSQSIKKALASPEVKQKHSEVSKKMWNNPEARQKICEAVKKAWTNPEVKQKISDAIKKSYENLETRQKHSQSLKKSFESPELRQKLSESVKKAYENPELRQKLSKVVKKALANPEIKQKMSQSIKKALANPEARQKLSNGVKKSWSNPEIKQKHLDSMKQFYAKQKQEFIEKHNLSKELLEEKFVENNRFDIDAFCKYCNICYMTALYYKRYFNIEVPNVQHRLVTQQEIFDFVSQYAQATFNDRQVISPKELDILIPERNIAIEFDGLLYHSTGYSNAHGCNGIEEFPMYHLEKTRACDEKGIKLFHIFEDEWRDKKEIWQSVLLNALGKSNKVYARKCMIKEVKNKEAKEFLNHNHLQGSCSSSINIGLYSDNTLISLMTFGKSRYNKQYQYELLRFCNILNTSVVGGASKLLSYFIKKYQPQSIISYANLRWSSGKLYENLGFTKVGQSNPNYFYFNEDCVLHSRIEFQKHKLKDKLKNFDEKLTESENMYNNGYRKIYDCGNLVFVLVLS